MPLPDHLFVSDDGALYDTRQPDWSHHPLRANYRRGHAEIATLADVKAALRAGPYTDLGGYPLYFVMRDGAVMCFDSIRRNFDSVVYSFRVSDHWRPVAIQINYEDADLRCAHNCTRIPSAYAEEDA